jgi:GNAT superfamily N-acetyltransferase
MPPFAVRPAAPADADFLAWLRNLPAKDVGYGHVRDDVPELSMDVVQAWRGQGVGRALLRDVLAAARSAGVAAVSLSVNLGL